MGKLDNKVIIVTGAAQGMGEATADLFCSEGANVIVADVNQALAESVTKRLGKTAEFQSLDVTSAADWDRVVASVMEKFGRIDGLVNNAAIQFSSLIENTEVEMVRKLFDVDLVGPWLGMKTVVPHMKQARRGSIVNISSNLGMTGHCGSTAYSAAKYGVRGMTKSLAKEVGPFHIRVNAVLPGTVDTPMLRSGISEISNVDFSVMFPDIALSRIAEPREIAAASLFLISDDASYISGADILVDGGWTCGAYTSNKPLAN